jgi:pentatricopeptide repeat protein
VTFSILVKLLSRAGRVDLACQLVQREMEDIYGIAPTRMVWSCLLTCCVKGRDLPKALAVLDVLEKDHSSNGGVKPSMYATVIEGCLAQGEISAALQLCGTATSKSQADDHHAGKGWKDWSADRPISTDLLRRCFEAAGARGGPEEEARGLLPSLGNKLGSPVRQLLEEALSRGGRRREPRSHNRAQLAHGDLGNGQSWVSSGADHWPSQHRGGYPGDHGIDDSAWDPSQWGWASDYNQMYYPGMDAYYGQNWQWQIAVLRTSALNNND